MIKHFEDPNSSKIRQPWENLVERYGGPHWRLSVENNVTMYVSQPSESATTHRTLYITKS